MLSLQFPILELLFTERLDSRKEGISLFLTFFLDSISCSTSLLFGSLSISLSLGRGSRIQDFVFQLFCWLTWIALLSLQRLQSLLQLILQNSCQSFFFFYFKILIDSVLYAPVLEFVLRGILSDNKILEIWEWYSFTYCLPFSEVLGFINSVSMNYLFSHLHLSLSSLMFLW